MWFVLVAVAVAILAGIVMSMMWAGRVASDAITTVEVIEPEPGVHCAKMLTTEGAAISCWKVAPCLLGGMVVMAETQAGKNACWGCNGPREKCSGKPKRESA